MAAHPVTIDEITAAQDRIAGLALVTPVMPFMSLQNLTGRTVWLKAENLQRTGSFKVRGALNALSLLDPAARAAGVVAASRGNHAQGVGFAAREMGVTATVFMPEGAAIPKVSATRGYDAEVRLGGADLGTAMENALEFARKTGARLIHPYDDPAIIAGQGTIGLEIAEQLAEPGTILIPVGGGGLISGVAAAIRALMPNCRIIGVQSEAAPTYVVSRQRGAPTRVDVGSTVADGIAVGRPSDLAFEMIEDFVDDLVTVTDDATTLAVATLLERAKLLVEPAGAVGVAAVLEGLVPGDGPVTALLSGGNIDLLLLGTVLRHGLEVDGRFASLTALVRDEPGRLAAVLAKVGAAGANVLSVDHHREGSGLGFGMVEVRLSVATRSAAHRDRLLEALADVAIEVH